MSLIDASQNFFLSELDISANSAMSNISGAVAESFDASATAIFDVSATVLQTLFQFYSDSVDITDINGVDLKYKVLHTDNSSLSIMPNFMEHSVMTNNAIAHTGVSNNENNTVPYDFVRYLALKMFGTSNGVDLFSNEIELRTSLITNARASLNSKLGELQAYGEHFHGATHHSPSRTLLNQIINNVPIRLNDLHLVSETSHWYYMPILEGDILYFVITLHPHQDQHVAQNLLFHTTGNSIGPRTYLMKINVVGGNLW